MPYSWIILLYKLHRGEVSVNDIRQYNDINVKFKKIKKVDLVIPQVHYKCIVQGEKQEVV